MKKIFENKQTLLFFFFAILIIFIGIFAPQIATHNPYEVDFTNAELSPSLKIGSSHFFGTDKLGRDLFSRIVYGTRISLFSTLILTFLIFFVGTLLGIISGYFGGIIDSLIMRISDVFVSFPGFVLAMGIAGILGPSLLNAMIGIFLVSFTKYARLSRSLVLKIKSKDYISGAILSGSKKIYILRKYFFKNIMPILIITATTDIGTVMLEIASLSFLGFGAQAPSCEWGLMLNEGRDYFLTSPWLLFFPCLAIFVVVAVFNLLGDSLRDSLEFRKSQL